MLCHRESRNTAVSIALLLLGGFVETVEPEPFVQHCVDPFFGNAPTFLGTNYSEVKCGYIFAVLTLAEIKCPTLVTSVL